ncbi:hypothetical protein SARC_01419 [Sphaeroforma arctica JP610]|uniref:NADH:flavin oxidoreductase/NADH oxidase N-terminal domain-containing protein n=1 Tax=Sphaeroforma arctica JP610 TaxID=667725 RepID=A0A0L0GDS2_9EUKA|nr:hypothetical protein SARC_01419 [Sphaeroforma arctica JP610]KNC86413.1 hypothetical protein SARC_01419 [Sphaeroforma arctica JP610]|eukprot:XP_014160315.1 hypothetical protein SARC_01419 [Sphaeroforma arctica JP610]
MTKQLLSKIDLGGLGSLQNRIVMAALTRARANNPEHEANDLMAEYYAQRSGCGIILTEGTHISPGAIGWVDAAGIWTEGQVESWRKVLSKTREAGDAKVVMQLWHQGRQSHPEVVEGSMGVIAPSAIRVEGQMHLRNEKADYGMPRALTLEEIPKIVEEYRHAAAMAKKAGFDGVQIHSANGYLIDTFLQSCSNHREDSYGGSVENRIRFMDEVIKAVLQEWPADKVGIKLSPNGIFGGMGSEDNLETFDAAIKKIAEHKLVFIELIDGLNFGFHKKTEPYTLERAQTQVKSVQGNDPVTHLIGNCGYTQESGEMAIADGNASLISYGRLYMTNPDLPMRFKNNAELVTEQNPKTWMTHGQGANGYTDYEALFAHDGTDLRKKKSITDETA